MFLVVGIAGVAMALCGVVMMVYGIRLNNKKQRAYIRLMAEREDVIKTVKGIGYRVDSDETL